MTARRRRPADSDARAVRRASAIVGWQITAIAATIVIIVVVLVVAFVIDQSQPRELLEKPVPGETKIYVDSHDVLTALIVVGIFAIVVAGVLSWVISRRAVRPLGEALRIQRTFVADASHELRTPLAVLDARIQLLQRRLPAGHELEGDIAEIRRDTGTLVDVVSDLLLVAASERVDRDMALVDINGLLAEAVESMRVLAAERGIRIDIDARVTADAHASPTSIRRCIVALLDNAMTHSPDGSVIGVRLTASKGSFEIAVTDHGSGITGVDPAHIFDRFTHSQAEPQSMPGRAGFGIGLALVRDIVVRNGGAVHLRDTTSAGTTISFTLPRG